MSAIIELVELCLYAYLISEGLNQTERQNGYVPPFSFCPYYFEIRVTRKNRKQSQRDVVLSQKDYDCRALSSQALTATKQSFTCHFLPRNGLLDIFMHILIGAGKTLTFSQTRPALHCERISTITADAEVACCHYHSFLLYFCRCYIYSRSLKV